MTTPTNTQCKMICHGIHMNHGEHCSPNPDAVKVVTDKEAHAITRKSKDDLEKKWNDYHAIGTDTVREQIHDIVSNGHVQDEDDLQNMVVEPLLSLLTKEKTQLLERVEREVRKAGDTSDYPEWKGAAGINVGLIPKEKILAALAQIKKEI